jgi:hypothetical protein
MPDMLPAGRRFQTPRPVVYRDGFSESAWKSLAIKSLRIGWPEGLRQAFQRLTPHDIRAILVCGLFEDTFPAADDLQDASMEAGRCDLDALCTRQTHHGRGHTGVFCDLEHEAAEAVRISPDAIRREGQLLNLRLPPRSLICFYAWQRLHPNDSGVRRTIDDAPWRGMPSVILDGHTVEGRSLGQRVTLLSGHSEQHRVIGTRVMREGWQSIRAEAHALTVQSELEANGGGDRQ